jgi:hypothetical protein
MARRSPGTQATRHTFCTGLDHDCNGCARLPPVNPRQLLLPQAQSQQRPMTEAEASATIQAKLEELKDAQVRALVLCLQPACAHVPANGRGLLHAPPVARLRRPGAGRCITGACVWGAVQHEASQQQSSYLPSRWQPARTSSSPRCAQLQISPRGHMRGANPLRRSPILQQSYGGPAPS